MTQTTGETRKRILIAASRLFAQRGYHGTSTRDIAEQVGMRQPSIYKHFTMKSRILAELLDAELIPALGRIRGALLLPGPAAPRLHAYLQADVAASLSLPYDIRGLYNDDVLASPELLEQAAVRAEIHGLIGELMIVGIEQGEFLACDVDFVQQAIIGLYNAAIRERGADPATDPSGRALDVGDFVLRATLLEPLRLGEIRAAATSLVDVIEQHATRSIA